MAVGALLFLSLGSKQVVAVGNGKRLSERCGVSSAL